eukprot:scaffold48710_cov27-Tisochrysis_lutea.AAC.1
MVPTRKGGVELERVDTKRGQRRIGPGGSKSHPRGRCLSALPVVEACVAQVYLAERVEPLCERFEAAVPATEEKRPRQ